ncbi:MAG: ATP-grasp fold amidoligase family protein [Balneolaceae bacterium]
MFKKLLKFILSKFFWGAGRHFLTDKQYAKIRYRLELGRSLNLENPQRFTEKIQYIKLYERTQFRKMISDRIKVREYVSEKVGNDYLIPLTGVYKKLTPNIWKTFPSQFVLKANHGCGMVEIVLNKAETDFNTIYKKTEVWKKIDYYQFSRAWVYKDLSKTLLVEKLLLNSNGDIPADYKFFCFHGRVEIIQVDIGRFESQKRNLYNRDFHLLDAELLYSNDPGKLKKPERLNEAIQVAESLSADINFIRIDLYLLDDHIYVGELTAYPGNGFIPFKPESLEQSLGGLITLNNESKSKQHP